MRYLDLFVCDCDAACIAAAGGAPNSGAFAMSQSGAEFAAAKRLVEDKKQQPERDKESAK